MQIPLNSVETTKAAQKNLKEDKSLVYGRLVSETGGYGVSLTARRSSNNMNYGISSPPSQYLFSKHKEDNRDGYFFIFMPPDNYKIKSINFGDGQYAGSVEADLDLTVPKNSVVYLGTFVFSWNTTKNYLVIQKGGVQVAIQDEGDDALNRLRRRFPGLKVEELNLVNSTSNLKRNLP